MNVALTIAGSDSGGGAGIQADLKTFQQFGVFGTSVLVAVTAQNTEGVTDVHAIPPSVVKAQMAALAEDLRPEATKTGMLATAELVRLVAQGIDRYGFRNYVLDPVMVATSGDRLLTHEAERDVASCLIPLAALVTPNIDEAEILVRAEVRTTDAMTEAGHALLTMGASAALIKGGHLDGDQVTDVLVTPDTVRRFGRPRIQTTSTHGTGCTLSAAIVAGLARGRDLTMAVESALDFVHRAIQSAPGLGKGHGPLNHLVPAPS